VGYLYILSNFESRTTVDMDFLLRNQSTDINNVIKDIKDIISIETENEFIAFDIIKIKAITVEKKYPGVSIQMMGKINNTRTPVNVDFGVGDVVVPKTEIRNMKAQLDGFEDVKVHTYSLESTVAEKLDAILQRFELTSRMKDFYDIWYISTTFNFEGRLFSAAIKDTFLNRGTIIEDDSFDRIKGLAKNSIILERWDSYKRKMKITLEIEECIEIGTKLLNPVIDSLLNDELMDGIWDVYNQKWV